MDIVLNIRCCQWHALVGVLRRRDLGRLVELILLVLLLRSQTHEQRMHAVAQVQHDACGNGRKMRCMRDARFMMMMICVWMGWCWVGRKIDKTTHKHKHNHQQYPQALPKGVHTRKTGSNIGSSTIVQNAIDSTELIRYGNRRLRLRCVVHCCDMGESFGEFGVITKQKTKKTVQTYLFDAHHEHVGGAHAQQGDRNHHAIHDIPLEQADHCLAIDAGRRRIVAEQQNQIGDGRQSAKHDAHPAPVQEAGLQRQTAQLLGGLNGQTHDDAMRWAMRWTMRCDAREMCCCDSGRRTKR